MLDDESSQGWAGADAFTAEFCALGGTIAARGRPRLRWAPDGSDVGAVPPDVDGVALMLDAFTRRLGLLRGARRARMRPDPAQRLLVGPAFVARPRCVAALPASLDGVVSATLDPPAADTPALAAHVERFAAAFPGCRASWRPGP